MPRPSIRFRPPLVAPSPEILWVLSRAFGPLDDRPPWPPDPPRATDLARLFAVSGRIAHRQPRGRLLEELGEQGVERLLVDRRAIAARSLTLLEAARDLAAVAAESDFTAVFLKLVALETIGCTVPGSRDAGDVDVLVSEEHAGAFHGRLLARGYQLAGGYASAHQLPPLRHPYGGAVEIHRRMPGVRLVAGGPSASLEALAAAGLLVSSSELGPTSAVPARVVQVAHTLVHGIAQHGWMPTSYPLMRMVGDLIDLGLAGPRGEVLARHVSPWLARDLGASEIDAARRLAVRLATSVPGLLLAGTETGGEAVLLRHILAGRLDEDYRRTLKLRGSTASITDRRAWIGGVGSFASTVFLSRARIDAIYGSPASRLGYLRRRLARPFDLTRRLAASLLSARRMRRRGLAAPSVEGR